MAGQDCHRLISKAKGGIFLRHLNEQTYFSELLNSAGTLHLPAFLGISFLIMRLPQRVVYSPQLKL